MITLPVSYNEPLSLEKPWPPVSEKHEGTVEKFVSGSKLRQSDERRITMNCFLRIVYLSKINMIQIPSDVNNKMSSVSVLN